MRDVKSIGVIGGGVVGKATARSYFEFYDVRVYDIDDKRSTHRLVEALECDIVFVCLPTPKKDGVDGLDTSILEDFFERLEYRFVQYGCFVIKSTVPVGATEAIKEKYGVKQIVHSPEFLTARCADLDALFPARNVIGGTVNLASFRLNRLYTERFPGVQTVLMSSNASELLKLVTNGFFAVKVAFFNEVHNLVESSGIDWAEFRRALLSDGRIHSSHTMVPGPDGKPGFGGTCLPKDAGQLGVEMDKLKLDASMVYAALDRNEKDRKGADV
jgi:UDPglucose 6-dehydrogenase